MKALDVTQVLSTHNHAPAATAGTLTAQHGPSVPHEQLGTMFAKANLGLGQILGQPGNAGARAVPRSAVFGHASAPSNGGLHPAPRNGGLHPAPRNGGLHPAPRNSGLHPAPRNGGLHPAQGAQPLPGQKPLTQGTSGPDIPVRIPGITG